MNYSWIRPLGRRIVTLGFLLLTSPWTGTAGEYAVVGDGGHWNARTQTVRDSILAAGLLDLVMPGDNLYKGTSYEVPWAPWRDHGFRFPVVAIGNHHAGYAREVEYFGMPGEFYSVRPEPGVHFIVLNSDNPNTVRTQAEFLRRELSETLDPLVFVVFHHPPVTVTSFHAWTEKRRFHQEITPILVQNKTRLTALLVGHDHVATWLNWGDLPVFVSGATHEVRRADVLDGRQRGMEVRTVFLSKKKPIWLKLTTEPRQEKATFEFIRAEDSRLECRTSLVRGTRLATRCQNE